MKPRLTMPFPPFRPRAKSDPLESDFAQDSLKLEHFLRRTGIHFGGKCSGFSRVALAAATLLAVAAPAAADPAGDPAKGARLFVRCIACHATEQGAPAKMGPTLWGVVGRVSGGLPGFNYSPAMKAAAKTWDAANLDAFLAAPLQAIPGNRMAVPGLAGAQDRADMIAYLATLH